MTTIETARGSLVAVALPRQNPATGLVWRVARRVDARVLKQVSEANVGASVVVVFRAIGKGNATIRFGLTRGESSGKAQSTQRHSEQFSLRTAGTRAERPLVTHVNMRA